VSISNLEATYDIIPQLTVQISVADSAEQYPCDE